MYLKERVHLYSARTVSIPGMVVGKLQCGKNVKLNEDVKAKKKENTAFSKTLIVQVLERS